MNTISVIIPTYNRASYIKASINSVLVQKLPKGYSIEVIVIDDGSTDSTEEILKEFKDKIIYKKINNSGRPAIPRNIGIRLAKGEIIAFQDSDDLWVKDKIIKQLPTFDDPKIILSYGNAEFISEDGKKLGGTIISSGQASSGDVFNNLLLNNFISTLTVMARRAAIIKTGLFNESLPLRGIEDYELWLRLSRFGEFQFIDSTLAYYRTHDGNISSKDYYTSYRRLVNVFRSINGEKLSKKERILVKQRLAQAYLDLEVHSSGFTRILAKINGRIYA